MKVTIQSDGFTVDQKLVNFIESKLNKLETFYDAILESTVYLRVEPSRDKENKLTEVKLHISGHEFIVKKQTKTFEESTDQCAEALRRILIKHKEKVAS
ncbi:MAG: ribosome hibernation-promoting factor, HPF/YfiA family [Flavobacteriales bacterium]